MRDERDGRLHFRHPALGFVDAFQAAWAQAFLLGNGANLLDVRLDIRSDQWAIAAHPALQIDKVIVVTDTPDMGLDLFTLRSETLVLPPGRFERLRGVLQAHGILGRAPWTARVGLSPYAWRVALQPLELRCGVGHSLVGRALFGRHGSRDRFDQLMLHME